MKFNFQYYITFTVLHIVKCCLLLASHDTHVFRLAEPLNETIILDKLDYPINMWGAENGKTNPVNV